MVIMSVMPTLASAGVQVRVPVEALNVAQLGTFEALKVRGSPSGSAAVGVNVYEEPAASVVAGVPAMIGGRLLPGFVSPADSSPLHAASANDVAMSNTM